MAGCCALHNAGLSTVETEQSLKIKKVVLGIEICGCLLDDGRSGVCEWVETIISSPDATLSVSMSSETSSGAKDRVEAEQELMDTTNEPVHPQS